MPIDIDKKFLLKKVKLLVVGSVSDSLLGSIGYIGFENYPVIENPEEALKELSQTFHGFVICTDALDAKASIDFIRKMRGDEKSLSRFSQILAVLDSKTISKELIEQVRDSGATEMILSNVEIISFREKVLSIVENPRNFIISRSYTGPDRRRKKVEVKVKRRKDEE